MATQIQLRRGTAAQWTSANPTLSSGEPGYETDTGKFKIGNGSTAWASLAYASSGGPLVVNAGNLGAAYTLDCGGRSDVLLIGTLTANCTVTPTNMVPGQSITLELTQDATGSRTLVFSPTAKKVGGQPLPYSTAAGAIDVVTAYSPDGTALRAFMSGRGMA
jgi:hypothetical protein